MQRRDVLVGGAAALLLLPSAHAQTVSQMRRIALVHPSRPTTLMTETGPATWRAFFAELRQRGFVEGQNLAVERRSAQGRRELFPQIVTEVVRLDPEVIVVNSTVLALQFKAATASIPIVVLATNPVGAGLVASFARPGANITGLTPDPGFSFTSKQIELLAEVVPRLSHVAHLGGERCCFPGAADVERDARALGVTVQEFSMEGSFADARYNEVFGAIASSGAQAVVVADVAEHFPKEALIASLAAGYRLPLISQFRHFTEAGALMSYGVDWVDLERRRAAYVAQILNGAKPSELPIEHPAEFELVVNSKTAKALGLSISPVFLARADEVIE